jgi:hypothetical protein
MTLPWLRSQGRADEALTTAQQVEIVQREREQLEKRVKLIEDMLAAIRRDDLDDRREEWR